MLKLDNKNFEKEISKGSVVVDFWADWCMPCKMLGPIFEELSNDMKKVKFGKVNVDECPDIAEKFFVQGIPAILVFKDSEEVGRIVGLKDKNTLKKEIETML